MFCIWVAIIVLLAIVEAMTINLTTIWFVISGIIALSISFINNNFMLQLGIFCIVGILLLITTRPILQKWLTSKQVRTNLDRIIGMKGIVTEEITKNENGEVKVDGKKWTAYADTPIQVNSTVKILLIDGVKIKVEKWED